ncbi:MAG: sigma-70 family RNA polymerase sigma factor [Polyangiaceae bacterium]
MAFEAIYREHFAAVWRGVQRFGVPERDAADAAQEVFLIAYRGFERFEGRSSVRTWLFGIAFRVAAGRLRLLSNRRELLTTPELLEAHPDPNAAWDSLDLRRLCELGLGALPLEQRAVFTLFELEGFSGEEIAQALELPLGTVRSRLRLARAAFTRTLQALQPASGSTEALRLEAAHE